jgi:uncharacterized protein (TIGR03089 family)
VVDVWTVLQARKRAAGGAPVVTYVDGAGAVRTELSATSLENAAAKVANALRDEFDLAPGACVGLLIPVHWQRSAWCAGSWTAGLVVDPAPEPGSVDLLVVGPAQVNAALASGATGEVAVVSLHPLGLPGTDPLPGGATDVTVAVRQQPDAYLFDPPAGTMPALRWQGRTLSQEDVLQLGRERAAAWGLEPGGRLLAGDGLDLLDSWLASLAVPLGADASVVLAHDVSDAARVIAQEHITATASSA